MNPNANTIHFNSSGMVVGAPTTPASLPITTKTVELIDGFVGQVVVNGRIVWQSRPKKLPSKARSAAERRIQAKLEGMFA